MLIAGFVPAINVMNVVAPRVQNVDYIAESLLSQVCYRVTINSNRAASFSVKHNGDSISNGFVKVPFLGFLGCRGPGHSYPRRR